MEGPRKLGQRLQLGLFLAAFDGFEVRKRDRRRSRQVLRREPCLLPLLDQVLRKALRYVHVSDVLDPDGNINSMRAANLPYM
jgi:hypothetical protein